MEFPFSLPSEENELFDPLPDSYQQQINPLFFHPHEIFLSAYYKLSIHHLETIPPSLLDILTHHLIPFIQALLNPHSIFYENIQHPLLGNSTWEFIHTEQILNCFFHIKKIFTDHDLMFLLGRGNTCSYQFFQQSTMQEKINIFLEFHEKLLKRLKAELRREINTRTRFSPFFLNFY